MDVRQCKRCNKLFQYTGNPLCHECLAETEKLFAKVRDFIYDHPQCTMEQICEATEVEPGTVRHWLREGRLITGNNGTDLLQCESCGTSIAGGRYCSKCNEAVRDKLTGAAQSLRSSDAFQPVKRQPPRNESGRTNSLDRKN